MPAVVVQISFHQPTGGLSFTKVFKYTPMLRSITTNFFAKLCLRGIACALLITQLSGCDDPVESFSSKINSLTTTVLRIDISGNTISCVGCSNFGRLIKIQGDVMAISDNYGLFLFERKAGNWVHIQSVNDYYNNSSAGVSNYINDITIISPTRLVVGAIGDKNGRGRVELFERSNSGSLWKRAATIERENDKSKFGTSIHIVSDRMIIGAPDPANAGIGKAFVYRNVNGQWTQESELKSCSPFADDGFGSSVRLVGNFALVTGNVTGKPVQVFKREGTTWTFHRLSPVNGVAVTSYGNEIMVINREFTALTLDPATGEFITRPIEQVDQYIPHNFLHGAMDSQAISLNIEFAEMHDGYALVSSGQTVLFKLTDHKWTLEKVFQQPYIKDGISITNEFFALGEFDKVTLIPR
jgi:hypothetical protein